MKEVQHHCRLFDESKRGGRALASFLREGKGACALHPPEVGRVPHLLPPVGEKGRKFLPFSPNYSSAE